MSDEELTLLLMQIIRNDGNIDTLLDNGFTYSSLSSSISRLKEGGLIETDSRRIQLTEEGRKWFDRTTRAVGKRGIYKYFFDSRRYRLDERYPVGAVYVPPKIEGRSPVE